MGWNPPLMSGPIAPESNPPIEPQYYQPSVFTISALTLGQSTTVTTAIDHNYVVGQIVRLLIPQPYGSYQLNESEGTVTSIPAANQVVTNINSLNVNTFIPTISTDLTLPQIIPIGDYNSGQINTGRTNNLTYIPGSFINISPN